jgi:hypothetical protein
MYLSLLVSFVSAILWLQLKESDILLPRYEMNTIHNVQALWIAGSKIQLNEGEKGDLKKSVGMCWCSDLVEYKNAPYLTWLSITRWKFIYKKIDSIFKPWVVLFFYMKSWGSWKVSHSFQVRQWACWPLHGLANIAVGQLGTDKWPCLWPRLFSSLKL